MNISQNLERLMTTKNVTAYKLAKDLGVSRTSVMNWLGGNEPHAFMLDKISAYFGCSVSSLEDKGKTRGREEE